MRSIIRFCSSMLVLLAVIISGAFIRGVHAQPATSVLAQGSPALTQAMVDKMVDFLQWALDIDLAVDSKGKIQKVLVNAWRTKDAAEMESTINIAGLHDKLMLLSDEDRNLQKSQLQPEVVKNLRAEPDDEVSQILIRLYDASRSTKSAPKNPSARSTKTGTNKTKVGEDGFTGIYRMLRPRALNINNSSPESGYYVEHITFLPSGHVYWTLPPEGLLYFDPVVAQRAYPDDWGTYEFRNGAIHILRGPAKEPYVITRSGERLNNPPSLGKGSFRRVPAADGLRLDGNYRRDPTEPTLSFTKDGRFVDGGVFRYFGDLARPDGRVYQDDGRAGSGTYLIEQNTLELRYSDGRIKRHPFTVFPENLAKSPAIDSFILRAEESMKRH